MQALRLAHDILPRQIITPLLQHFNQQMSLRITVIDAAVVDITFGIKLCFPSLVLLYIFVIAHHRIRNGLSEIRGDQPLRFFKSGHFQYVEP